MAGRIFVSYRRAETAPQAGWLYDRLAERFGRPQVVKDAAPAAAEFDNFTAAQIRG